MSTELVDREGFPRSDLDVYNIRMTRHQIVLLRNDFKQVNEEISKALVGNFETLQQTTPFARIDKVDANSPAFECGLKEEDLVCRFGSVDIVNHRDLTALAGVVTRNENVSLQFIGTSIFLTPPETS